MQTRALGLPLTLISSITPSLTRDNGHTYTLHQHHLTLQALKATTQWNEPPSPLTPPLSPPLFLSLSLRSSVTHPISDLDAAGALNKLYMQ